MVDANHQEICKVLRKLGAFVQDLSRVGEGVPALLIGVTGRWYLVEIKDGAKVPSKRALTPDQVIWHAKVRERGLPVYVVETTEQAIALLENLR